MSCSSSGLEVLELTRALVEINSANPFLSYRADDGTYAGLSSETKINIFLEKVLCDLGFKVSWQVVEEERDIHVAGKPVHIKERFNLLAEKGEGENAILFFGHTDTVDAKLGWPNDPYTLSTRKGEPDWKYYGLGANDMKGGIAAMLLGIGKAKIPHATKLKVAILVDEEYWSYGAHTLTKSDFLKDIKLAFVSEVTDQQYEPGEIWLGLGRLGRAEFEVEVTGKSCHGADTVHNKEAINACHEAIKIQNALLSTYINKSYTYKDGPIEISSSQYISTMEGGRAILSVPEYAKFTIDKSLAPGETAKGEIKELTSIINSLKETGIVNTQTKIAIKERERPTPPCKPFTNKIGSKAVTKVISVLENLNIKPIYGMGRSVADENRIAALGIPTLLLCPNGAGSHTNEEWVDVRSLEQLERIYRGLVENL